MSVVNKYNIPLQSLFVKEFYIITVNNEILIVKNKLWTQLVYTGKESIERWNNWLGKFNTEKQIIENLWKSLISPLKKRKMISFTESN